jgi:hypothetical protein
LRTAGTLGLTLALVQALVVLLFGWPAAGSQLHRALIVVAGPASVAEPAARSLQTGSGGGFSATRLPDLAAARAAVRDRRAYAAVVIEADGLRLLIASAASPAVAQQVVQAMEAIQARGLGTYLEIEDVAPNPQRDQRGMAPAAALLALLVGSVGTGALILRRLPGVRERVVALIVTSAVGGLAGTLMLHTLLGALEGSFLMEAGVLALVVLAAAAAATAFGVVAGMPGVGLSALILVAVSYPISGATSAPEFVPRPWDAVGRLLPAGAGNAALRDVAFFDGAGSTASLLTLFCWAVLGLVVTAGPAAARRLTGPAKVA